MQEGWLEISRKNTEPLILLLLYFNSSEITRFLDFLPLFNLYLYKIIVVADYFSMHLQS